MGGCYGGSYGYSSCSKPKKVRKAPNPKWKVKLKEFAKDNDLEDLVSAYKSFFRTRTKGGFFGKLAEACKIETVNDIPKEFSETEYEVKFDIEPYGKGTEPSVVQYLNAFDFPVSSGTRFLKDPVNHFAEGINHFIGDELDERLVVIEKCGKTYLKEKGLVEPVNTGVPFEHVVIKRSESRYSAGMEEIISKTKQVTDEPGVEYKGKIRKEKGDAFILDTNDGRIYSMTITRAHLTKAGEKKESDIQRQLELEYAGYVPGFKGFEKDSERQIVQGMVDLAKYTAIMYNNAPITDGWRMNLQITGERKYDFVIGKQDHILGAGMTKVPIPSMALTAENAK
ncbi:MAG: hypothetical protein PHH54_00385 [Candidatus Nanoarchaeia archaeon]|nr:hypothetical protein [Candidatus Nanoarchaeia archaeon]MDD5740420.1 hypothetical protein [Candidatus Nanoarchaeia archaeon]